jgi:hypothetical protein
MTTASTYPNWINDGSTISDPLGYGERAVEFLTKLRHPASNAPKRSFQLYPFQECIVRRTYAPEPGAGSGR